MNFDQNKFGQPFNAGNQYFNQLSARIQQNVGIEVQKIGIEPEKKIDFSKKNKPAPVQLTVEFGFPLTSEKIEKDEAQAIGGESTVIENVVPTKNEKSASSDIGEIHIEPLNIQPNANPYWHEFNADDELEGLVLDSEGQEMSDITIAGDGIFDLDQQIFHEIVQPSQMQSPISNESITDQISLVHSDEKLSSENIANIISDIHEETTNQIDLTVNSDIKTTEIVLDKSSQLPMSMIDEANTDIISSNESNEKLDISSIDNNLVSISDETNVLDVSSETVNQIDNFAISGVGEDVPSFSFSFIPEITESTFVNNDHSASIESNILKTPETVNTGGIEIQESSVMESAIAVEPVELEFLSADLDAIHDEMSANEMSLKTTKTDRIETPILAKAEVELEFSDADLDMLHSQMANESVAVYEQSSAGRTLNMPKFEDATTEDSEQIKPTLFDMIPWSSIFGIVASLMAIASAWFIWNSIQKPIAIDEYIDKAVVASPKTTVANASILAEQVYQNPADYIASEILDDANNTNVSEESTFRFSELSERSKVSAVELEKLGLMTLDLEDNFFEGL